MVKKSIASSVASVGSYLAQKDRIIIGILFVATLIGGGLLVFPGIGSLGSLKHLVLGLGIASAVIVTLVAILQQGKVTLLRDPITISLIGLVGVTLISALFSGASRLGVWGALGDTTSVIGILMLVLIFFLSVHTFSTVRRTWVLLAVTLGTSGLLLVYHVLRFIFGPSFLSFGLSLSPLFTPAAEWFDLGVFFGLGLLLVVLVLEFRLFSRLTRILLAVLGVGFYLSLLVMNIRSLWIAIGFLFLMLVLYVSSFLFWNRTKKTFQDIRTFPIVTLLFFLLSVGALVVGPIVHQYAQQHQQISYTSVRPNLISNIRAGWTSLKQNPVIGTGPALFDSVFLRGNTFTPQNLDQIDGVKYGASWVMTLLGTTGVLGILAVLAFFVLLVVRFGRVAWEGYKSTESQYTLPVLFFLGLYIFVLAWIDLPGIIPLAIGMMIIGAWYGLLVKDGYVKTTNYSFLKDPRSSFFGILGVLVLFGITFFVLYNTIRMFVADQALARGLVSQNSDTQAVLMQKSFRAWPSDRTARAMTLVTLGNLNRTASALNDSNKELLRADIQGLTGQAIGYANEVVGYNRFSPGNWTLVGDVYQTLGSLGISDAWVKASEAYQKAQAASPHDPRVKLSLANLSLAQKDVPGAKRLVQESLAAVPSVEGYRLAANISLSESDRAGAKELLRNAIVIRPTDGSLYLDLAVLFYKDVQYREALAVIEAGLRVDPGNQSLYFYYAKTLSALGRTADADQIVSLLRRVNPQTDQILKSLDVSPAPVLETPDDKKDATKSE
ncbi:MAG: hypothetical protein KBC98_01990 [Candidatus Pacebacteria bacterium]|nr:hypothetical protein [Candidatus Paceibacterota bacterium]